MKLQTKYFGTVEYDPSHCLTFSAGLFGFSDERRFMLLPFEGSQNTLLCLQSTETPGLAFVVMDPFALCPGYAPELQPAELAELGVSASDQLSYYVLCAVRNPVSDSTVNLKCPVVINPHTLVARQVILETDAYEMRHPLSQFRRDGDGSC